MEKKDTYSHYSWLNSDSFFKRLGAWIILGLLGRLTWAIILFSLGFIFGWFGL